MMRALIISFLLSSCIAATAQIPSLWFPAIVDSLSMKVRSAAGKEQIETLNLLSLYLAPKYPDSCLIYARQAFLLATEQEYMKGKGVALFNTGNGHYFKMDAKNALFNYFEALRILEELEPSHELGNLYLQLAFFTDKANNCRNAIRVFMTIGDHRAAEYARMKIPPYIYPYDCDSSYILAKENLEYYRKKKDDEGIYQSLYDLSNACFYICKPEGLDYALKALEMAEKTGDKWRIANAMHKVINFYKNDIKYSGYPTDHKLAESMLLRSRDILLRSGLPYRHRLLGETYRELGYISFERKDYPTAIHYYTSGLATIDTFRRCFDTILFPEPDVKYFHYFMESRDKLVTCFQLRDLYARIGEYQKAYQLWQKADSIPASWTMNVTDQQIIVMQANYEDQKKRQQISLLEKENEIRRLKQIQAIIISASTGGSLLFIMISILLFFQRKRFNADRTAILLEQKLLRSQMNPHFLFNSLTSIQNFIINQRPEQASIYLSRFSSLVRSTLDNSVAERIALERELSTIENYLELQKVRYAGMFEYRIRVSDEIDTSILMIPPMLVYPFIENAIEHGVRHRKTMGHIQVRFDMRDKTLAVEVEDDGVGRQAARDLELKSDPGHKSMGTAITHERLINLNKKLDRKITLQIRDLKDEFGDPAGTLVRIEIPIS